jgi:hypothetical protein
MQLTTIVIFSCTNVINFKKFWNLQMLNLFQEVLKQSIFARGGDGIHVSTIVLVYSAHTHTHTVTWISLVSSASYVFHFKF